MNKNAFINAACALLGAGGRGFVKALVFVLLGAFCAPVFGAERYDPFSELRVEKDPVAICKMYGLYHNGECHVYLGHTSIAEENPEQICEFALTVARGYEVGEKTCAFNNEGMNLLRRTCTLKGRDCPWHIGWGREQFMKGVDPKTSCGIDGYPLEIKPLETEDSLLADIRRVGVLGYIKRNFNLADEQRAIIGACQAILGTLEGALSKAETAMKTCKTEKAECLENSYCPYKDSEYEAGLRGLEKLREPYLPLAEEAKKCIKDTENFLNPAAPSE